MSNSQLNKLQSAIKTGTEETLNLSSNLRKTNSNNQTNFPHKLILTNKQWNHFENGSSANAKFSKTQLSKMQARGVICEEILGFF